MFASRLADQRARLVVMLRQGAVPEDLENEKIVEMQLQKKQVRRIVPNAHLCFELFCCSSFFPFIFNNFSFLFLLIFFRNRNQVVLALYLDCIQCSFFCFHHTYFVERSGKQTLSCDKEAC